MRVTLGVLTLLVAAPAWCSPAPASSPRLHSRSIASSPGQSTPELNIQQDTFNAQFDGTKNKVPIHLGVMSKCPDAQICEIEFDRVLDKVASLVTIDLVYIGSLDSSEKYGVKCMHGSSECLGNIQQLCVAKHWMGPSGAINPWADWWNFVQCVNYGPTSRIGDPSLARSCAKVVGHAWDDALEQCVTSDEGAQLLQESIALAKTMQLQKSCTIIINGKQVCIHDGTWKSCPEGHEVGDFVRQIRNEWTRLNDV